MSGLGLNAEDNPNADEHLKAYEILLECRKTEIDASLKRTNVCIVVQAALLAFAARGFVQIKEAMPLSLLLGVVGIILTGLIMAVYSGMVLKGSSFWVNYWERRLGELEGRVLPHAAVFRDHPSAKNTELLESLRRKWNLEYVSTRGSIIVMFRVLLVLWLVLLACVVGLYAFSGGAEVGGGNT